MSLALSLGRRGLGQTWPNPSVGCVIVKADRVLGRGSTAKGGRPHAETEALAQAGAAAKGATAYVTLEPCAHHGKTPPCAQSLIDAGISRVVSALTDPDTRVSGRGHAMLRKAGIEVSTGCMADEARRDQAGFLSRIEKSRPFVTLKLASSFDGRIATASGESQWITSPEARHYVHHLRATHDAVMIGSGTAMADDPSLTVRGFGKSHQPLRIVCDTNLQTDPSGVLGQTAREIPVWMCHGASAKKSAWQKTGAELIECAQDSAGRVDVDELLKTLAQRGLTRVFCEGGGQLAASLMAHDLVDQLIGFTAGVALGADGTPSLATLPSKPLSDYSRFKLDHTRAIGPDVLAVWRRT